MYFEHVCYFRFFFFAIKKENEQAEAFFSGQNKDNT